MIPIQEIAKYGATENVGGTGAMTADALAGQLATTGTSGQVSLTSAPAIFSTAPYKPPRTLAEKARQSMVDDKKGRGCEIPTCLAFAISDSPFCYAHSQKPRSQRVKCGHEGCGSWAKKDQQFCRWHNE